MSFSKSLMQNSHNIENSRRIQINIPTITPLNKSVILESCSSKNISLDVTLDLDALFGKLSLKKFISSFKVPIELDVNNKNYIEPFEIIKTNTLVYSLPDGPRIKDQPHVRIGYSKTNIGSIDIYLYIKDNYYSIDPVRLKQKVFKYLNKLVYNTEVSLISRQFLIRRNVDHNDTSFSTIKGQLLTHDFNTLFRYLRKKFYKYSIGLYCEAFGNKNATMTSRENWSNILEMVSDIFREESHSRLNIDLCISVTAAKNNSMTFASERFFRKINLLPNYKPLFCNSILN